MQVSSRQGAVDWGQEAVQILSSHSLRLLLLLILCGGRGGQPGTFTFSSQLDSSTHRSAAHSEACGAEVRKGVSFCPLHVRQAAASPRTYFSVIRPMLCK